MRSTKQIKNHIDELDDQRRRLLQELAEAQRMEVVRSEKTRRRRELTTEVLARLEAGEWVAGCARLWWCRDGEGPVRRADADELEILDSLAQAGVVERGVVGR